MALDTIASLFSRIQTNLGRGAQSTIVSLIPDWVNLEQREICREGKWWFNFGEDASVTLSAHADTYSLPSDFIDEEYVFLKDANGVITMVEPMENIERRTEFTDLTGSSYEALPTHYLLRSTDLLFRPIANQNYTVIFGYWKALSDLYSGGPTNALFLNYQRILECGGTYRGFEYMQEYDDAAYWKGQRNEEFTKMRIANADRELPGEFVLSVRPGQKSTRIGGVRRRNYY